jgi:hypothetical protein
MHTVDARTSRPLEVNRMSSHRVETTLWLWRKARPAEVERRGLANPTSFCAHSSVRDWTEPERTKRTHLR